MAIETVKRPYELLVRWREGKISGAHVGFELTATEDGKVLSTTPLPVMTVDIGQGIGFPLKDILDQVHVDAITGMDTAQAEVKTVNETCAKHEATIVELEKQLTNAQTSVAALNEQNQKLLEQVIELKAAAI
jgi:uncharacterized coiled-coil protein SlyX